MGLGCRVVSHHYWPITREESPVHEDLSRCPLPCWGGRGAHRALGSGIFCHRAGARALV
jgi:hypothetical protein